MIHFVNQDGRITRRCAMPVGEAELMCADGEWFFESAIAYPGDRFYLPGKDLQPVEMPGKPSILHEWGWQSLSWVLPCDALLSARAQGALAIDDAAGRARSRHITIVPGQGETYTAKYQEALGYIAADYPADLTPYPFVAGESQPNTWMTPTQSATRIATIGGYWREILGPAIEAARINGKDALDSLTDPAAIDAHVAAVVANLDAI